MLLDSCGRDRMVVGVTSTYATFNDKTVIISIIKGKIHDFCVYDNYISENLPFRVKNVIK
jgi:hypothetical protein